MKKHPFWGTVEEDWAGFSSDISFSHSFFDEQGIEIFLGDEYDEDGEEIELPPSDEELDHYSETYKKFIDNFDEHLINLQKKAFERYTKLYAHYYENSEKSGQPPLNIDTVEKHNKYITDLMQLRISEGKNIRLTIRYELDTEHGLEFKFVDNQIQEVGGIGET